VLLYLSASGLHAQSVPALTVNDSIVFQQDLPGLSTFIEAAQTNSPILKSTDSQVNEMLEKIKKEKLSWTDFILMEGNFKFGKFNTMTISQNTASTSDVSVGSSAASKQLNYFTGVTLRLPMSAFVTKKNDINSLKYNVEEIKMKREELKNGLTLSVIDEYYKLLTLFQAVKFSQNIYQSVIVNYVKAQKDIGNGLISLVDYNHILISKEKAEQDFVKSQNDYLAEYYKIQVITGLKINSTK
jgi:outer membrane protein TolC